MTKILVIDDETILRGEVIEWLTLEGYEAMGAEDGVAGVEAAARYRPDLIICDITMPKLDGQGVLLELRANPATADIPFIFETARAAYEDIRKGMDQGADDYLTKPFTRLQLLQAIHTRLQKKTAQEQLYQHNVQLWQTAFEQEREQRLLKAKLVAMFSHDFRNPLTAILSSNELLRDYGDRLDESRRLMHFNRVEAAVHQLLQMLDDMLVVSQMETGSLAFKPEQVRLDEFLQRIVEDFQAMDGEAHRLVFESHFAGSVKADPRLLRQIVVNLLSNAVKYSPQGSEVRVKLACPTGQVSLTVSDQGIGIPEADQPRLFTTFQRASNVGNVYGMGLGLAIVKHAVDLHGGAIQLETAFGKGTTIKVEFPA